MPRMTIRRVPNLVRGVPSKIMSRSGQLILKNQDIAHPSQEIITPQFPGQQKGLSKSQVQTFIKDQVRRKGFAFSGGTAPTDFPLQLSGTARFFYGLAWNNAFGLFTLTINNEVVVENTFMRFMQFGFTNQDYYAINRPLSGQDDIKLTITGLAGYNNEQLEVVYK